jgi:hypothetical protein
LTGTDLAGDEPVEQVADRGEALLDARCGKLARTGLDPGGDMHRLHGADRRHAHACTPVEKFLRGPGIGPTRVWMLAAKNSRKRIEACSPAAASVGRAVEVIGTIHGYRSL